MQIQPYLFFEGRCDEAIGFYQKALGADVKTLTRYKDNPEPPEQRKVPFGSENKVMHSSLQIVETTLMASDGLCSGKPYFRGVLLTLSLSSDCEAEKLFAALGDDGKVQIPLTRTFFPLISAWSPTA
jgi:PhnB protein